MNKKLIKKIAAGVMVLAIFFTGFTGLKSVFAQTDTPETPSTTEAPGAPSVPEENLMPGRGFQGGDDQNLAEALGKTAAELQQARKDAFEKAVDQALENGALTQAQADRLKAGNGNGWGLLARYLSNEELAKLDETALFADALGVSVEELNAAYAKLRSENLADLVESGKLTQEQADLMSAHEALMQSEEFQADVKAGIEAAIQNAVKAGTISQAQADALLAQLESSNGLGMGFGRMGNGMFDRKGMMGPGFGGMFDQMRGQMFEQGGPGKQGRGNKGMFGQGGPGMNGYCDGSCQNAPVPTEDSANG